ncbi:MAG TPA: MraY family glycosyltransferase [Atribacteraceae bacterium]|nr:MraY family glycosyltransferase [Atribacteraceae bacterium]
MSFVYLFFILAFCLTAGLTPLVIFYCQRVKQYDLPDGKRKIHRRPISRLGGLAVFASFLISSSLASSVVGFSFPGIQIAGLVLIFATGFLDDLRTLSPYLKLGGQLAGVLCLMNGGALIQFFTLPWDNILYLGIWGYPLTVLWFIGIINALNLIDGMDGLSGGIASIAALTLGIIAWQEGRLEPALISFVFLFSVLGFLPFNFPPAKVFLGDGGALLLGSVLALISVQGAVKSAATFTLAAPILVLGVPISDTLFAIIRRKRNGLPIMFPDRGHLHHRLLERGYSQTRVVLTVYGISAAFGLVAILIDRFLTSSTYSLLLFLALFVLLWRWGKNLGLTELSRNDRSLDEG